MIRNIFLTVLLVTYSSLSTANIKVGSSIPKFSLKTHEGRTVTQKDLEKKWTIFFFYPKADTPGCTKQACAFRDNSKRFDEMGVQVFGVSVNTMDDQKKFAEKYQLKFPLLADENADLAIKFDVKMPFLDIAKRWTFIIGPDLKIKDVGENVDPVLDSQRVIDRLIELKK